MKQRILYALAPLSDTEYQALMTQVAERVNAQRVTHCGKEYAKGSRNPNRGGVVSASSLPAFVRNGFVTTR